MKLIYDVEDKPKFSQLIVFAFQQLLAIMAATIAVPDIVGNGMTASAALFGHLGDDVRFCLERCRAESGLHPRFRADKSNSGIL